jgi:hypothetical protein
MNAVGQLLHLTVCGPWEIRTVQLPRLRRWYTYAVGPELPGEDVIRCDCCADCAAQDHLALAALAKIWSQ